MSISQDAVSARAAAIADVQRLLQHPDDLNKLPALMHEYKLRQQATKAALSSAVGAQVESIRGGMELLRGGGAAADALRADFASIDALCVEGSSLIQSHDKIRELGRLHANLHATLRAAERIAALPREAAAAQRLLEEEAPLLQVYSRLVALEGTSIKAQAALEAGAKASLREAKNLSTYFQKVRAALVRFEERLWSVVRAFLPLARSNPGQLIDALQAIELQHGIDQRLLAAGQASHPLRKAWRRRAIGQLGMSVQERFSHVQASCSHLAAANENTSARVAEVLQEADGFVAELADVSEYVQPCFPPDYRVFELVSGEYVGQLRGVVDCIGACTDSMANEDILQVARWARDGPRSGLGLLIGKYVERVTEVLSSWLSNIARVGVAAGADPGALLAATAHAALGTLSGYQVEQRAALRSGSLGLEQLCAAVNNSARSYDEALEFAGGLDRVLDRGLRGSVDAEPACRGFLALIREAMTQLVGLVFGDPGMVGVVTSLGAGQEWVSGAAVGSILATLEDYLQDFQTLIKPPFVTRLVDAMMVECVAQVAGGLISCIAVAGDDEVAALRRDHGRIVEFFSRHVKPAKAMRECQVLAELTEFVGADSLDGFVLAYGSMLSLAPRLTPALLSGLLNARVAGVADFSRADAKEVMEECKEVWDSRHPRGERGAAADTPTGKLDASARFPAGRAPTAKEAAVFAVVTALRRSDAAGGDDFDGGS